MIRPSSRPAPRTAGVALVLVLSILVLVTIVVVAVLTLAQTERTSAGLTLQRTQAGLLADAAVDNVQGVINDAVNRGSQEHKSWASEPGRIWIFSIATGTGVITRESVDLISALPKADPDNVDLNRPSLRGEFPIAPPAPGESGANMKVGWLNFLRDPASPPLKTNQITGRVAYWVDDESCKVNINTADGSQRMNATPAPAMLATMASTGKYSFGFGTPSEINLAALPGLDQTKASAIAEYAWKQEFNSAEEITRVQDTDGKPVVTTDMLKALRFDVTHYNSSPNLNFMGEPRIDLQFRPEPETATSTIRKNIGLGAYDLTAAQNGVSGNTLIGMPMDHIYPQPRQLLKPAYLGVDPFVLHTFSKGPQTQRLVESGTDKDYYVGKIITQYLSGKNLQNKPFTWPKFDGASSDGFVGKYSPRQLDSITLQILDTAGKTTFVDQNRPYSFNSILNVGWLSGQPVLGIGRAPRYTEFFVEANTTVGDPLSYGNKLVPKNLAYQYPLLQLKIVSEVYFPKGNKGVPNSGPYDNAVGQWQSYNNGNGPSYWNYYDCPQIDSVNTSPTYGYPIGRSGLGTYWMDTMLTATDQNGQPAGIDFMGVSSLWDDPDQTKAALYHPYCNQLTDPAVPGVFKGRYSGSVSQATGTGPRTWGILEHLGNMGAGYERSPGTYTSALTRYATTLHPARIDATSIHLLGGWQCMAHFESSGTGNAPYFVPFDTLMPEFKRRSGGYTTFFANPPSADELKQIMQSVVPLDLTVSVPGIKRVDIRVADPLVNMMPKDWKTVAVTGVSDPEITMKLTSTSYKKGGTTTSDPNFPKDSTVTVVPTDFDGDNPGMKPSGGGDPLLLWLPNQDTRLPKQARFPSVGALFSIRTGSFPDKTVEALTLSEQHGVPFRGLNMSPSTQASQQTDGGSSYPDWAMLDLFDVAFLPQKPFMKAETEKPFRRLTYGGATIGRMNINNPEVPYPFAEKIPGVFQTPPKRNALKALFQGLTPSKSYDVNNEPVITIIDAAQSQVLAKAVADYQKANGPFFMTGQVANVPAVASYLYTGGASSLMAPTSISRNDVVRDVIGATTTRSNVFSVWVVAQTVKKLSSHTRYDTFEAGDTVTSEVRRRYLIERSIVTGKDGIPGNGVSQVDPLKPNTFTFTNPDGDPIDASYNPSLTYPLPYRWRIISVQDFQL